MNRNIQVQNYFEHIGTIQNVNFYGDPQKKFLHVFVLTATRQDWQATSTENVPLERYGDTLSDWQAYEQSIKILLEEFCKTSAIGLQIYWVGKSEITDYGLDEMEDELEPLTKFLVLVADPFALQLEENRQLLSKCFDTKDKEKIKGCLFLLDQSLPKAQREHATQQRTGTFRKLSKCWGKEFYKSYTHVELDVPNKNHFFRRLANIAYLRGIQENETPGRLKLKNERYQTNSSELG
ncbi:MAG: hypothetical protein AAF740_04445 [Bacteroidota bacterium]